MWSADRYIAALRFAAGRHLGQKVPGTELPYVVHLATVASEVAGALAREPFDRPDLAIQCALLHDVIEDTPTTYAEVAERFGDDVAAGVQALTKDAALPKPEQMPDSLRRIRAMPREVWIVKLGDRIANLEPPPSYWTAAKRRAYRDEARDIHRALAGASPHLADRLTQRIDAYAAYLEA